MGAFSEIDIDQQCNESCESPVETFQLEQAIRESPGSSENGRVQFEDDAQQQAEADAAPREMEKLMKVRSQAELLQQHVEEADEDQARKTHEESEAKRKAEWEAARAAKKAQQEEQLQKITSMGEDELLAASAKRINKETERLTRRNMKEYVAEHIQTLCLDDLEFARLTMHPRKSFMHCIWFINRKAREYLEQEMKDNGIQRPYGVNGMYGGDVPDDLVYQWAEDYYRDMNAEEDKDEDEEFKPKPYTGPTSSKSPKKTSEKKSADRKTAVLKKAEKSPEPKPDEKEPVDDDQISLGDFLEVAGKAS